MTKDTQIEALQERLSQVNLVIDVVVSKLKETSPAACNLLTKEADKSETLLIKIENLSETKENG